MLSKHLPTIHNICLCLIEQSEMKQEQSIFPANYFHKLSEFQKSGVTLFSATSQHMFEIL